MGTVIMEKRPLVYVLILLSRMEMNVKRPRTARRMVIERVGRTSIVERPSESWYHGIIVERGLCESEDDSIPSIFQCERNRREVPINSS